MRRHLIFGALILLVTVTVGKGSPQATFTIHPDELEGHEFVMRPTVEGRRKVYLPAPDGPCCMDHPEGCLIMVFFNTGDNLDAT